VKHSKYIGLLVLFIVYLFAFGVGVSVYHLSIGFIGEPLLTILLADVIATIFVWGCSLIFKTSSIYDPYWSVQPPVILLAVMIHFGIWDLGSIVLLVLVSLWSLRLTANFIYTFTDLSYQDWRYTMLREKSGKLYPLVNFFGIHLFPTIIVYACVFPMLQYVKNGGGTFNALVIIGIVLVLIAIMFETLADLQMQQFRRMPKSKGEIIRIGLWKHNRHPNYFGEILMWWGIYAIVFALAPNLWFVFFGALVNTLMFLVISIPMAENRLATYKPNFEQYRQETWKLMPLPFSRRRTKND